VGPPSAELAKALEALERDSPRYSPYGWRGRLGLVVLAVVTALGITWALLDPPGGVQRLRALGAPWPEAAPATPLPAPPQPCTAGQAQGCIGGRTQVLVLSPAAQAPAPNPSASTAGR
jgi:hypothetical protein